MSLLARNDDIHWEALNFLFCEADWLVQLYFSLLEEKSSSCSLLILGTPPHHPKLSKIESGSATTSARSHNLVTQYVLLCPMDLHISNLFTCSLNCSFSMGKPFLLQTFLYVLDCPVYLSLLHVPGGPHFPQPSFCWGDTCKSPWCPSA